MLLRPIPPSYRPFKVHSSFFWAPLNQWHMNIFSLLLIKTSGWNLSIIFSGTLILLAHNPVNMCLRKHILKPGLNSLLLETACRVFCGVFFFCEFVYFYHCSSLMKFFCGCFFFFFFRKFPLTNILPLMHKQLRKDTRVTLQLILISEMCLLYERVDN